MWRVCEGIWGVAFDCCRGVWCVSACERGSNDNAVQGDARDAALNWSLSLSNPSYLIAWGQGSPLTFSFTFTSIPLLPIGFLDYTHHSLYQLTHSMLD